MKYDTTAESISAAQIEAIAAQWVVRMDGGASSETREALDKWLKEDVRHKAAYARLSLSFKRLNALRKLKPLNGSEDADLLAPARPRKTWVAAILSYGLPVAAALVLCAITATFWLSRDTADTHSTRIGEFRRISLGDGSTIALNTNSEARVRYTRNSRHVELIHGEALFDVARNPDRPFDVKAGDTTVRAVGTVFSVRLHDTPRDERVDVVVSEGQVSINPPSSKAYGAGSVSTVQGNRIRTEVPGADAITHRLSWTTGLLEFYGETLGEVVAEINRYNQIQLVVADPKLRELRVSGSFTPSDAKRAAANLEIAFNIKARGPFKEGRRQVIRLEPATPR